MSTENEMIRDKISGLLYTFNKNKMDDLMSTPEFCNLVLHFINMPDIINMILKARSDSITLKNYEDLIQKLKIQCMSVLSN